MLFQLHKPVKNIWRRYGDLCIHMWGVKANFFNKTAEKANTINIMCKHIICVWFSPTNIPFHYPIPIQVIWWECRLTRGQIQTCNGKWELSATTWGVEFNLISTACILYTTLFKSPYWSINNYANYWRSPDLQLTLLSLNFVLFKLHNHV